MILNAHPRRLNFALAALTAGLFCQASSLQAQPNYATPLYFRTLAGSGTPGLVNGQGTVARFNLPNGVAVDAADNIYVADSNNFCIRKITPGGEVTTVTPTNGTPSDFSQLRGIAVDRNGNVYIGGYTSSTVYKLSTTGVLTTLAGKFAETGTADGIGAAARFGTPLGLVVDLNGDVYVVDRTNHTIRKITPSGEVSTFAGQAGQPGSNDGEGTAARFNFPWGITMIQGVLYVSDTGNHTIRRIVRGVVSTLAGTTGVPGLLDATGTAAQFRSPTALTSDGRGTLYVGGLTAQSSTIRKITLDGVVTTLAGTPERTGSTDGSGAAAEFNGIAGLALDQYGQLYVADSNNHKIRRSLAPPLAAPPTSLAVNLGGTAELTVRFLDSAPTTYQWLKNGVPLTNATGVFGATGSGATFGLTGSIASTTRIFSNVQASDAGIYSMVLTNAAGQTTTRGAMLAVVGPPNFVTQPASQTVTAGLPVQFNVTVTTSSVAIYQWRKDGVPIAGASSNTFRIGSAVPGDAGSYAVTVTNSLGTATSNSATLTVTAPVGAVPITHTVSVGSPVQLNSNASAPGTTFQWRKGGTAIPGATNATFSINSAALTDAGDYTVATSVGTVTQLSNTVTLIVVPLSPPVITTQPANQTVTVGASAQFSVAATSAISPNFQWRKNGVAIAGATNALLTIPSASLLDTGSYSVLVTNNGGATASNNATLSVNVPVSTEAVTHTVTVGSPVQLSFTGAQAGTSFQWRKNGTPISGATNAIFSITSAALTDAGNYTVVLTTAGASQVSNTATLVVVPVSVPVFVTQPVSQTATSGASVHFSVVATSSAAMSFQWRKNGAAIAGATTDSFSINNAQANDSGVYTVSISNSGGSVTSNDASLTVTSPVGTAPTITAQPADQNVNAGETILLGVSAAGLQPLAYQWRKNGTSIPGATSVLYTIPDADPTDAASYSVVVTNSAGSVTSNPAVVRLIVPPVITTHPASQSATAGDNVQFSVAASGTTPLTYQWRKDGTAIAGATNLTLALNSVQLAQAGSYTVGVTNSAGAVTSSAAALTVTPAGPTSRVSNVSVRTNLAANQTVIIGISVDGGSRDVLVRAVGPSLSVFGVSNPMLDPRVDLYRGQTLVLANDDWASALAPTFANSGAFALLTGSRDAALRMGLDGAFSIQVRGTGAGVVLIEAYDLGQGNVPRLVNISARNRVGPGEDILIAGFTITGTGTKQLLIRAVGPGLAPFNVPGTLVDPRVDVLDGAGVRVAENDNWAASLAPSFSTVSAFGLPAGSRDAALLTTLPAGSYTVQVRGTDGGSGEAIVEVYEVP